MVKVISCVSDVATIKTIGVSKMTFKKDDRELIKLGRLMSMGLSPREIEVALMILDYKVNKEIAQALFVEVKTIKFHTAQIYKKSGIIYARKPHVSRKIFIDHFKDLINAKPTNKKEKTKDKIIDDNSLPIGTLKK